MRRKRHACGLARAILVMLLAARPDPAAAQATDYAWDFNDSAGMPHGFSHRLDVEPPVRDALLRQVVGDGGADAAARLADHRPVAASVAPLVAVRLSAPQGSFPATPPPAR